MIVIIICYTLFQLLRGYMIKFIWEKWMLEGDPRWLKYDLTDMVMPNKKNWFGFKLPKDKDYE